MFICIFESLLAWCHHVIIKITAYIHNHNHKTDTITLRKKCAIDKNKRSLFRETREVEMQNQY